MKVKVTKEEMKRFQDKLCWGCIDEDIVLEATPVEESRPWILCSSAANHDKAQKMGIDCDCFKLKPLTRKHKFRYPVSAFDLNSELDQIYQALNELRKK